MKNKQILRGALAGLLIVFICSSLVIEKRLHDVRTALDTAIEAQEKVVIDIAPEIGSENRPEFSSIEGLIAGCKSGESQEYDELLATLDKGLTQANLSRLEELFAVCGSIPAQKRSVMVFVFEQEVESLIQLVEYRALLGDVTYPSEKVVTYKSLIEKEVEIKNQYNELVNLQGDIINTLSLGAAVGSESITTIQTEVQTVQQKYATAIAEASKLRALVVTP